MGPSVEGEQDVVISSTKDLPEMEILIEEIGINEGAQEEDRISLEIQIHGSLLGEIEELKFLLGLS